MKNWHLWKTKRNIGRLPLSKIKRTRSLTKAKKLLLRKSYPSRISVNSKLPSLLKVNHVSHKRSALL